MKKLLFFLLILLIFIPVRFRKITSPLKNITSFRQSQTATVALNFYHQGINFYKSELDIFGKGPEKYLTLEFPLYQAVVAVLYRLFSVNDMWGRVVSLISGFIGSFYLYSIVLHLQKNIKLATLSAFFFLSVPLNMFHQRDFLIEATVTAFLLSGFYYALRWQDRPKTAYLILAVVLLSVGFVQKIIYGPFLFIPLIWRHFRKNKTLFTGKTVSVFIIPMIAYLFWQHQADLINISHNHSYFTSVDPEHLKWNMGSLSDRFSPPLWQFRLRNLLNGLFLKPGLLLFLIGVIAYLRRPSFRFFYVWLLAALIYFLTFFAIQSHIYYQMIIVPITSIFMAAGLIWFAGLFFSHPPGEQFTRGVIISSVAAFYLWRSLLSSSWDASLDLAWYGRLMKVGESVRGEKYGLLVNPAYDWNSVYSYYPRLKLLTLALEDFTPQYLQKQQEEGYSYVILHRYSEYPDYPRFMNPYPKILELEDFQVYLINEQKI